MRDGFSGRDYSGQLLSIIVLLAAIVIELALIGVRL